MAPISVLEPQKTSLYLSVSLKDYYLSCGFVVGTNDMGTNSVMLTVPVDGTTHKFGGPDAQESACPAHRKQQAQRTGGDRPNAQGLSTRPQA